MQHSGSHFSDRLPSSTDDTRDLESDEKQQLLDVLEKFRNLRPYLNKRLKSILDSRRERELADLVDEIKYYLKAMQDDANHGIDTILGFIECIHEMIRRDPVPIQNHGLTELNGEDEDNYCLRPPRSPSPSPGSPVDSYSQSQSQQPRRIPVEREIDDVPDYNPFQDMESRNFTNDIWRVHNNNLDGQYSRRSDVDMRRFPDNRAFSEESFGSGTSDSSHRKPRDNWGGIHNNYGHSREGTYRNRNRDTYRRKISNVSNPFQASMDRNTHLPNQNLTPNQVQSMMQGMAAMLFTNLNEQRMNPKQVNEWQSNSQKPSSSEYSRNLPNVNTVNSNAWNQNTKNNNQNVNNMGPEFNSPPSRYWGLLPTPPLSQCLRFPKAANQRMFRPQARRDSPSTMSNFNSSQNVNNTNQNMIHQIRQMAQHHFKQHKRPAFVRQEGPKFQNQSSSVQRTRPTVSETPPRRHKSYYLETNERFAEHSTLSDLSPNPFDPRLFRVDRNVQNKQQNRSSIAFTATSSETIGNNKREEYYSPWNNDLPKTLSEIDHKPYKEDTTRTKNSELSKHKSEVSKHVEDIDDSGSHKMTMRTMPQKEKTQTHLRNNSNPRISRWFNERTSESIVPRLTSKTTRSNEAASTITPATSTLNFKIPKIKKPSPAFVQDICIESPTSTSPCPKPIDNLVEDEFGKEVRKPADSNSGREVTSSTTSDISDGGEDLIKTFIVKSMSTTEVERLNTNPEVYNEIAKKLQEHLKKIVTDDKEDKLSSSSGRGAGGDSPSLAPTESTEALVEDVNITDVDDKQAESLPTKKRSAKRRSDLDQLHEALKEMRFDSMLPLGPRRCTNKAAIEDQNQVIQDVPSAMEKLKSVKKSDETKTPVLLSKNVGTKKTTAKTSKSKKSCDAQRGKRKLGKVKNVREGTDNENREESVTNVAPKKYLTRFAAKKLENAPMPDVLAGPSELQTGSENSNNKQSVLSTKKNKSNNKFFSTLTFNAAKIKLKIQKQLKSKGKMKLKRKIDNFGRVSPQPGKKSRLLEVESNLVGPDNIVNPELSEIKETDREEIPQAKSEHDFSERETTSVSDQRSEIIADENSVVKTLVNNTNNKSNGKDSSIESINDSNQQNSSSETENGNESQSEAISNEFHDFENESFDRSVFLGMDNGVTSKILKNSIRDFLKEYKVCQAVQSDLRRFEGTMSRSQDREHQSDLRLNISQETSSISEDTVYFETDEFIAEQCKETLDWVLGIVEFKVDPKVSFNLKIPSPRKKAILLANKVKHADSYISATDSSEDDEEDEIAPLVNLKLDFQKPSQPLSKKPGVPIVSNEQYELLVKLKNNKLLITDKNWPTFQKYRNKVILVPRSGDGYETSVLLNGFSKLTASTSQNRPPPPSTFFPECLKLKMGLVDEDRAGIKDVKHYENMLLPEKLKHLFKCMGKNCSYSGDSKNHFFQHLISHGMINQDTNYVLEHSEQNWICCAYCSLQYTKAEDLCDHIVHQHSKSLYQCGHCFYRAYSGSYIDLHYNEFHRNEKPTLIKCEKVSNSDYAEPASIKLFVYRCSRESCSERTKQFAFRNEFMNHLKQCIPPDSDTSYTCHICFTPYEDYRHLVYHYKLHSIFRFQCFYCIFGSEEYSDMESHAVEVHPNLSGKIFDRDPKKDKIIKSRSAMASTKIADDQNVNCSSNSNDQFKYHTDEQPEKKARVAKLQGEALYRCANTGCNFSAANATHYKGHVNICDYTPEDKLISCFHCPKKFNSVLSLMEHIKIHRKQRRRKPVRSFKSRKMVKVANNEDLKYIEDVCGPIATICHKESASMHVLPDLQDKYISLSDQVLFYPKDIDDIPMNSIFSSFVGCAVCTFTTKVRSNIIRHLRLHLQSELDGGKTIVPTTAPVNPVPCLEGKELMSDKMRNWAGSSHENKQ